ncbi:phosphocholine-specific phospholipase C [Myroides sp. LJL110]
MSSTRRDFIKISSLFASGLSFNSVMPSSIARALSIEPEKGSSFLDAEHVVFLMQENRSFDHAYGSLTGVRGFNDPRAMRMPNDLPVWFQSDPMDHKIYGPFHLDIVNTKITWMGSLPHSWTDMVSARDNGSMDNWIDAKRPGATQYKSAPLTMGYFTREDIPFYYALADAFTVCDQHFCSSLTGTSSNRSFFWSGTVRKQPDNPQSTAHLDNHQINYKDVSWTTYPEKLEKAGISWRVYQNELSIPLGLDNDQENWLANFTDNNLEFHKQYNVRLHKAHTDYLLLELERVNKQLSSSNSLDYQELEKLKQKQIKLQNDVKIYNPQAFEELSDFEKNIHKKAFTTNIDDPHYHSLELMEYEHQGQKKQTFLPKGDIFYQFRKDVDSGNLPMVSWLVAPCNFSDHPGAPWFGAWYLSQAIDILTKDPQVFKKTIFILTYDENDGYFDHIAPFVPALSGDLKTGKMSEALASDQEWVTKEQERLRSKDPKRDFQSPIGLGFRVPMVVVSPWTKGGWVNSEVCDLTSTIQFLEYFIEKKTGKKVYEDNISPWRRAVCGNMSSVFQNSMDHSKVDLDFVNQKSLVQRVINAKDNKAPNQFNIYSKNQILQQANYRDLPGFAKQEKGVKKACALPYNILADLQINQEQLVLDFGSMALNNSNKNYAAPLQVYSKVAYDKDVKSNWNFTVLKQQNLQFNWNVKDFQGQEYHLAMHGPNGFYREFKDRKNQPWLQVKVSYSLEQELLVDLVNLSQQDLDIVLLDKVYLKQEQVQKVPKNAQKKVKLNYQSFHGWYELQVLIQGNSSFLQVYAGHIENNKPSITDPYMASLSN